MPEKPVRVLHVDDQHLWRSTVSDYLTLFGDYEITSAESGEQALEVLRTTPFDIIISDYQMPEMNGIEFLHLVRKRGTSTPFIFLSGIRQEDIEGEARESGVDFYVIKTGDPSQVFSVLNEKIQQAIARYTTVQAVMKNQVKDSVPSSFL
ncbi:response regulator [Methanospirillum hungatei]|uniref:response regulator n=1 Tax=Methanospirillum hungatei TaxID=2203 RepID=UPI0026EB31B6|nr:response regulator [Methanospirillum hungatei]MCA1915198.1 response regulator [Methanospirillum hungatei]